jgi:hypothetical protein
MTCALVVGDYGIKIVTVSADSGLLGPNFHPRRLETKPSRSRAITYAYQSRMDQRALVIWIRSAERQSPAPASKGPRVQLHRAGRIAIGTVFVQPDNVSPLLAQPDCDAIDCS